MNKKKLVIGVIGADVHAVGISILQHAFEDRDEGTVDVSLCKGTLFHTVTVSDDGSGFALPWTEADGLGLKIVRSTVKEKLKGRLRISSGSGGTKVSFDFANELNNDFVQ